MSIYTARVKATVPMSVSSMRCIQKLLVSGQYNQKNDQIWQNHVDINEVFISKGRKQRDINKNDRKPHAENLKSFQVREINEVFNPKDRKWVLTEYILHHGCNPATTSADNSLLDISVPCVIRK